MSGTNRRDLLRSCPYFATLSDEMLDKVAAIAQPRSYNSGEALFFEGETEPALHVVESGIVRIFKVSIEGREQVLRLMQPGETFADVPAFDGGPYPANADAMETSVVLSIPREPMLQLMREHPDIALGALSTMASRARHLTALVEDLSLRRVMSRVANLLLTNNAGVALSQTQMASMVGTAREMVNRSLNALEDKGVIEIHGQDIRILDAEQLEAIVEGG